MCLILYGLKGVGKTTVGGLAAKHWEWSWIDLDTQLLSKHPEHEDISICYTALGEDKFLEQLSECVTTLELPKKSILSTSGALALRPELFTVLNAKGVGVYLSCEQSVWMQRVQVFQESPVFHHEVSFENALNAYWETRAPVYQQHVLNDIDVTHQTPEETVQALTKFKERVCG